MIDHLDLAQALELVKASGYKVTKLKAKTAGAPRLNCLGLPMSESFDPNYKMKYKTPPLNRKQSSFPSISPERWTEMCRETKATATA